MNEYGMVGRAICVNSRTGEQVLSAEVKLITPEYAKELLANNPNNRKISKEVVEKYARAMANGEWYLNGESIAINEKGELANGQHRLTAAVKADYSFPCVVVKVLKKETLMIDDGRVRTIGNQIDMSGDAEMQGINNNKITGAASFLLCRRYAGTKRVSKAELFSFIKADIDVWKWIRDIEFFTTLRSKKGVGNAPVFAAIAAAYKSGYSQYKLLRFADVLNSGEIRDETERPILRLRDYLLTHRSTGGSSIQTETYMRCQYTLRAFETENIKAVCKAASEEYYCWKASPRR